MRALLLHANTFQVRIVKESNRPKGIVPENKKADTERLDECLVVFFCVEKYDSKRQLTKLSQEITKSSKELSTNSLMIAPFVHLSSNVANPMTAKRLYESLLVKLDQNGFNIKTSHFGYHKSLLLDIKGHPGSFRYREF